MDDYEAVAECDHCGQRWTQSELDEDSDELLMGDEGFLWRCPGCHGLNDKG